MLLLFCLFMYTDDSAKHVLYCCIFKDLDFKTEITLISYRVAQNKSHDATYENLRTWSQANKMIINLNKSKEMVLGCLAKQPIGLPCLTTV